MSGISVSGVKAGEFCQPQTAAPEGKKLAEALREKRDSQPDLTEMMKEAREKAAEREKMFKIPQNSQRYGDAALLAYSKLARARTLGDVDAASGYARRQIARLRAVKRGDSDNADRIQAAINQLQKAVNRAGRKRREISQEKLTARRQARLEREKRTREAKRLGHQLRGRQTMRAMRESGYMREAQVDNRLQDQLSASRLEMRAQMQEVADRTQTSVDAAVREYAAASAEPAPSPEITIQA